VDWYVAERQMSKCALSYTWLGLPRRLLNHDTRDTTTPTSTPTPTSSDPEYRSLERPRLAQRAEKQVRKSYQVRVPRPRLTTTALHRPKPPPTTPHHAQLLHTPPMAVAEHHLGSAGPRTPLHSRKPGPLWHCLAKPVSQHPLDRRRQAGSELGSHHYLVCRGQL
jgi:hypothetical protein